MNYYNEHDPSAIAWLGQLINDKVIPVRTSTPMKNFDHIHDINELIPLQDIKRQFRFNSLDLKPRGKGNKAARRLMKLTSFLKYQEALELGFGWPASRIYMNAAFLVFGDMAKQNGVILKPHQRYIVNGVMRFKRQL